MHATSTPTLAQPKNGAFAALGAAAILTAAIGFGAVIGMNLPTTATPTAGAGSATQIEAGLAAKQAGEAAASIGAGSATQIEAGLAAKQAGEAAASIGAGSALAIEKAFAAKSDDGANAALVTEPFVIGGRDPQAGFNNAGIDSMAEYHAARAAAGWYPAVPVVDPLPTILYNVGPGLSADEAARAAVGRYGAAPATDLSYDQIRGLDGWKPFATVPQAPPADLRTIVPGLVSGSSSMAEYHAARAAAGWYPVVPVVDPRPYPLPTFSYDVVQDPATNLSDYFSARSGWGSGEGNTDPVGTSHR